MTVSMESVLSLLVRHIIICTDLVQLAGDRSHASSNRINRNNFSLHMDYAYSGMKP